MLLYLRLPLEDSDGYDARLAAHSKKTAHNFHPNATYLLTGGLGGLGLEVASSDEAREILSLKGGDKVGF